MNVLSGRWVAILGFILWTAHAQAFVQEMTAEFRPDPSNPMINRFKNTTPESGICPWHIPERCKQLGIFSIRTTQIQFSSNGPILGNHVDPRKGVMFKLPTQWRDLPVVHLATGKSETVQIRIAGIGGKFHMPPPYDQTSWMYGNGSWSGARPPCLPTGYIIGNKYYLLWSWIAPLNIGACNVQAVKDLSSLFYETFEFSYELRTPNPLMMEAGQYVGTTTYSIGPNADFDFGDIMMPTDNQLTFNFTLDVDHHLKVEVPPGGNRIQLEPQGGWQAWLQNGRKPSRLFRDQTVNLWASSHFKMTLECPEPLGNTCSMRNEAGHQVPLDVMVSLPPGLSDASGRPVNRQPLTLDGSGTELLQPSMYVDRKPSTLHFEVKAAAVEQMLEQPGSTYSGTATVVWDSEV
ncbi:hypothetical protein [Pseudomonas trivialis]|uniref:Uncharacterized protein n=1 Tax=Pseudomonas trivialis TaxID=200450 RepID=A0A0H5APJ8_9PSED|nr:hypothetical protein [Pseudomonas trivialis]AKS06147.1 hypothetical protein AA957_08525 [Pseudomonas trivialis]